VFHLTVRLLVVMLRCRSI